MFSVFNPTVGFPGSLVGVQHLTEVYSRSRMHSLVLPQGAKPHIFLVCMWV